MPRRSITTKLPPVLLLRLREEPPGSGVERIFREEMRKETTAVDEYELHRSSAYTSARCVYFCVETSVKSEWNAPAEPTQIEIA